MFIPNNSLVSVCLSAHSMGYDVERFVGYVNEGLLCCVCRDVLEDPLQAPCEHAFCSTCIHAWLVSHQNCPEDRLSLSIANLRPLYRYQITENMLVVMATMVSTMISLHNTWNRIRICMPVPSLLLCIIMSTLEMIAIH